MMKQSLSGVSRAVACSTSSPQTTLPAKRSGLRISQPLRIVLNGATGERGIGVITSSMGYFWAQFGFGVNMCGLMWVGLGVFVPALV